MEFSSKLNLVQYLKAFMSFQAKTGALHFYLRAIGFPTSCLILVFEILFEVTARSTHVWISAWTGDRTNDINGTVDIEQRNMRLGVYAGLGILQGTVLLTCTTHVKTIITEVTGKCFQVFNT